MSDTEKLPVASSADDLLAKDDLAPRPLEIPEWGATVLIRGLTRQEYITLKDQAGDDSDVADVLLLTTCLVQPKLDETQARRLLDEKTVGSVAKITRAIVEASGLGDLFRPE